MNLNINKDYPFLKEANAGLGNNEPDRVYYDMITRNYSQVGKNDDVPLIFEETRDSPILLDASKYSVSVVRFQVDTYSLPVFFCGIQPNQGNRDLSVYSVTLEYYDSKVPGSEDPEQQYIIWIPQDKDPNLTIPSPPNQQSTGFQAESSYYFCYHYNYLILLINNAIETAFLALQARHPVDLAFASTPFLYWDNARSCVSVISQELYFNLDPSAGRDPIVRIYFNRALYALFNSLPFYHLSDSDSFGRVYQLINSGDNGARILTNPFSTGLSQVIVIEQEYTTTQNFTPVSSILFLTDGSLPVRANLVSQPKIYINGQQLQFTNQPDNYNMIITDLQTDEFSYRPQLLYYPTAQFRYIDMINQGPLKRIGIRVFWRSKLNTLIPLNIQANGSGSIKLLFERKK
jgi:hypothetical protein